MRHDEKTMRAALRAFLSDKWSLRIPPDERVDPDLILASAIDELMALRKVEEAAREGREAARAFGAAVRSGGNMKPTFDRIRAAERRIDTALEALPEGVRDV